MPTDLSEINAAGSTKIIGSDVNGLESTPARVTPNQDVGAVDTVNTAATSIAVAMTTTPVELKVGASRQTNRKYIWMEANDNNIKWGFANTTAACCFDLFKNQLLCFPIGNVAVFAYITSGTGSVNFGEGA